MPPNADVRLHVLPGQSSHVYDLPISDEVATILPGDGTVPEHCDIIFCERSGDNIPHMLLYTPISLWN